MADDGTQASLKAMDDAFIKLHAASRGKFDPIPEALAIARQYPKTAALSGAIATYVIGYQVPVTQRVTAKDPMKSGIGLLMSKAVSYENHRDLYAAYNLAFTQTAYEREAKLISVIPFLNSSLDDHLKEGMTRHEFSLVSQVAVWSAAFITKNLMQDVITIGKAMQRS